MLALRSLARRLHKFNSRRPELQAEQADTIFDSYFEKMIPVRDDVNSGRPISYKSWRGFTPMPIADINADSAPHPKSDEILWVNVFWQTAFGSLVISTMTAFCETCNRQLPNTAKGKPSRRRLCKVCQTKLYKDSLPPEVRRKKWRDEKRKRKLR